MGKKRKTTYVIIDEFGTVSEDQEKEHTFGYAASVTDDLNSYNKLAVERRKRERKRTGKRVSEVKANRDSTWEKIRMAVEIRNQDVRTSADFVDKRSPPLGWNDGSKECIKKTARNRRNETRNRVLRDTIKKTTDGLDGKVYVIVDEHTAHHDVKQYCESLSNNSRKVDGDQYNSSDLSKGNRKYANALQTNDYVTNAAGSATKGFPLRALCMRMKIRKYREDEKI